MLGVTLQAPPVTGLLFHDVPRKMADIISFPRAYSPSIPASHLARRTLFANSVQIDQN